MKLASVSYFGTAMFAVGATAVILPLPERVLNVAKFVAQIPSALQSINVLMRFDPCAQGCILERGHAGCPITDVGCKCGDPEFLYSQAQCFKERCPYEKLQGCWDSFIGTCKYTFDKRFAP